MPLCPGPLNSPQYPRHQPRWAPVPQSIPVSPPRKRRPWRWQPAKPPRPGCPLCVIHSFPPNHRLWSHSNRFACRNNRCRPGRPIRRARIRNWWARLGDRWAVPLRPCAVHRFLWTPGRQGPALDPDCTLRTNPEPVSRR